MNAFYRSGLLLLLGLAPIAAVCQQSKQAPATQPIGAGELISTARIADPNELVGINGRIVKVSDFASLFSSLDSLTVQNLHIQEMRIGEKTLPTVPVKGPCLSYSAQGKQGQAGSCPPTGSGDQGQDSKAPQHQPQQ